MNNNNSTILEHPHSRFVASTNYVQHYTKQYEDEIVSKKKDFDNFFLKYRELKEDQKVFLELNDMLQMNSYNQLNNFSIEGLNSKFDVLADIHEKRGMLAENYNFLTMSLNEIDKYTKEINQYLQDNSNTDDISNAKGDQFSLEEQIKYFTEKGEELLKDVFRIEDESQRDILRNADKQILEAKRQRNSDI